ncbi:hypothetical protein COV20_05310 [Candidatus Woesearchaeota archaeon CG10_big_fil_rev_8_21_14_0_10_45_16]|nr:MAG: hypothetical protein COV20_05310 [Candidatus Woesearchaeota archaeon CG10_big_fil_rev_8_21_14_0_10_45_16]
MFTDKNMENVQRSFQLAKSDIYALYEHVKVLRAEVDYLKQLNMKSSQPAAVEKQFVASETGKKVHQANCLHAQKIKKRVIFKTKTLALNKGYKLCSCLAY